MPDPINERLKGDTEPTEEEAKYAEKAAAELDEDEAENIKENVERAGSLDWNPKH